MHLQKESRDKAAKAPPSFLGRNWKLAFALSTFIALVVFVFGFGFGAWASVLSLKQNGNTFGAFAACYQVSPAGPERKNWLSPAGSDMHHAWPDCNGSQSLKHMLHLMQV